MSYTDALVDASLFDENNVIAGIDEIQQHIPQRFEMSQLDAILYEDSELLRCVGYKDITDKEFWVRGHMPSFALMPGVIMCECAAQVIAYFASKYDFFEQGNIVGFGGLNDVKFRNMVVPGERLVVMIAKKKLRRNAIVVCDFQGFVNGNIVVEGEIKGIVLPKDALA